MSTKKDENDSIPHREKLAWVTILSLLVPYIPYFAWVAAQGPATGRPAWTVIKGFAVASLAHLAIYALGRLWLRLRDRDEATAPPDERDLAIQRRAVAAAYGLAIGGLIHVGCVMSLIDTGWNQFNTAVAAIVLAELVRCIVAIWLYRRGSAYPLAPRTTRRGTLSA
ncbi:MAG: hypothetical protein MUE97_05980 [Phycisphaerales bacterium]|nr:hypothetical protein [Phycisphaerales bacterium]